VEPVGNLSNRELRIRKAVVNGEWIQDGLRHGFATYYNALTKNPYKVCHVTGDIIKTVRRHYMRAVKKTVCDAFWGLTPSVVLADEQGQTDAARSAASSTSAAPDNPDKSTSNIKTSDCVIKSSSVQIASPAKKLTCISCPLARDKMLLLKKTSCGLAQIVPYKKRTTDQKVIGSTPIGVRQLHNQQLTTEFSSAAFRVLSHCFLTF
jgi:hypothetical protein